MTQASPSSRMERVGRGWWFDPRLAIGVALVAVSVLGVLVVVSAADGGIPVYVSRTALSPGDRVTEGDLAERSVRLGDAAGRYLVVGDLPEAGLVVTRTVAAGELVPASAVGAAGGSGVSSVVVVPRGRLAKSVVPGAVVDVWASLETEGGVYGSPDVLVSSATVVRLIQSEGIIADGQGESVELLVPRNRVARVLESIANDAAVSLVPVSIPLKEQG